jgi:glycolate oxidase
MHYGKIKAATIDELRAIVGEAFVLSDEEERVKHGRDETEDLLYMPEVVVKPRTPEEIAQIMKLAAQHLIPVTPQGALTGLSGGALPVYGGIALSMERFNQILHIDERNLQVVTEPGVITQVLQEAVMEKNLFYPPDPASRGSCFIGGNVAENSGGPKAVKYGVVKDYVLNLEVVLPSGEIIWTGANVLKNSTGYNLTQLFVGSEGTLGIITKIVLRLIPLPKYDMLMLIPFGSAINACEAVAAIFHAGITPSAMEFMERDAILFVLRFNPDIVFELSDDTEAHLIVEVDGNHREILMQECEVIASVAERFSCGEILFAENEREKSELWRMRRKTGEAVKQNSVYKEEDTVVPRAELPNLLSGVKSIGKKFGFQSVCYGHAGDGNLHVNILKGNMSDEEWNRNLTEGIAGIFRLVVSLGGTISGEHGIGLVQKGYMPIAFNGVQLDLFKRIKTLFDPHMLMNPGKVTDPA